MLTKGDKLVVTKEVTSFLKEGDIVEIIDVTGDMISFVFGDGMHKGLMNHAECEAYFKKHEEPKAPTVTEEMIDSILECSKFEVDTFFDKCTVLTCKLPNGFVIVESSACVSPENYDEEMGFDICYDKIKNKVWELEGYKLQDVLYQSNKIEEEYDDCEDCDSYNCSDDCCECDEDCNGCPFDKEFKIEFDDEDEDSDCDNCDDYDCPFNNR